MKFKISNNIKERLIIYNLQLAHHFRNHLEEEEKKMHHMSEVVEKASQKKKLDFRRRTEKKSPQTKSCRFDQFPFSSSEDEDLFPPKELKPINEENTEIDSGSGSTKLPDSGPTEIQEEQKEPRKGGLALVEKEKKAKEKKKLMEIIGKVLAKINSKEQREKAKKVLGSIVEKSEVRSRYKILHEL